MSKKIITTEANTFNATYAEIMAEAKCIKKNLKKYIAFIEKLSKNTGKLWNYGDDMRHDYTHNSNNLRPIYGIKNFDRKMDKIDKLALILDNLNDDIAELVDIAK